MEIDKGKQDLKHLLKNAEYIRVIPRENKLFYSYDKTVKVDNERVRVNISSFVELPITLTVNKSSKDIWKYNEEDITCFHLHRYSNAETLLTLLAHKPTELFLSYYPNNSCDYWDKLDMIGEHLTIIGIKRDKNGKVVKTHEINITGMTRQKGRRPELIS